MKTPGITPFVIVLIIPVVLPTARPGRLQAQAETIRGTVVADSGRAIPAADIYVTRAPDRLTQTARTDSLGHFSVRFAQGTGDYLVNIRALGYKPFRKRITRTGNDSTLVLDATLVADALPIAAVTATATRPKPQREGTMQTETAAAERISDGVNGALAPDQAGDLAAIAATIPGMLPAPGGVSALGLPADQNSVMMNGLNFAGGSVPRGASMRTRVTTSSYDPSRGGFSGAQISGDLEPGNIFSNRRAHVTLDAPQLQNGGRIGRQFGDEYSGVLLSAAADGEFVRDKWFYNVSAEARRRSSDFAVLSNADADVLTLAGVAPDSAQRLLSAIQAAGIPALAGGGPTARVNDELTLLTRIDHTPYDAHAFGVTGYANVARAGALALTPTVTPSVGGRSTRFTGVMQGLYSFYFGKNYLSDTRTSLTYQNFNGDPYLRTPGGRVTVSSIFDDGTRGIASLGFGGNSMLENATSSWGWETVSDVQLYTRASRHKVRLHARSLLEAYTERGQSDRFGTFRYQSLADVAANRPAAYSRVLQSPDATGGLWSGVLAIGDNLRKSQTLHVLYGVRFEANRYTTRPAFNSVIEDIFGAPTDAVPNRVHASPRFGFSWLYAGARANRSGYSVSNLAKQYFGPRGILRGHRGISWSAAGTTAERCAAGNGSARRRRGAAMRG